MVSSQTYLPWFWINSFMWRYAFNAHPHNKKILGFVHGERSDLRITSELKGTKLDSSRNVRKQQCLIICNLHKVEIFANFLFHISFNHILSHVHIMEQKSSFLLQNQSWKQWQQCYISSSKKTIWTKQWVIILHVFLLPHFAWNPNKLHPTRKFEFHPFSMVWKVVQTYMFWSSSASKLVYIFNTSMVARKLDFSDEKSDKKTT